MTDKKQDKISDPSENKPEPAPVKEMGLFDLLWEAFKEIPMMMRTLKFAVWMIAILAVFTLAGTLLPQEKFAESPQAFKQQYVTLFKLDVEGPAAGFDKIVYHSLVTPLQLYRIFDTPLYLILMCLLAISSALCALDRLKVTRALLARTNPIVSPTLIRNMQYNFEETVPVHMDEASSQVRQKLQHERWKIFESTKEDGSIWFFARKNSFRHYVLLAMHFAFVFIILGGILRLEMVAGYSGTLRLAEGESQPVASEQHRQTVADKNHKDYVPKSIDEIQLVDYKNIYREKQFGKLNPDTGFIEDFMGMPSDYVSHLKIIEPSPSGDKTIKEKSIEVNFPLSFDGVTYYQYAVDANLTFKVEVQGQPPMTVVTNVNRPTTIELPGIGITCVVTPADFIGGTWEAADGTQSELPFTVRLRDYTQAGTIKNPVLVGYVTEAKPLSVEGIVIHLDKVEQFTILQFTHDPGVPLVGFGGLILAIGMTLGLYFPYKTYRIVLKPSGNESTMVAGSNWRGVSEDITSDLVTGEKH
jgi:cytochrome c biogenesis protein ResB